jgi:hypothetical protein
MNSFGLYVFAKFENTKTMIVTAFLPLKSDYLHAIRLQDRT